MKHLIKFIILYILITCILSCNNDITPDLGIHVDNMLNMGIYTEYKNTELLKYLRTYIDKEYYDVFELNILLLDKYYSIPYLEDNKNDDVLDLIYYFDNTFSYISEKYDCDKFSLVFRGYSILTNYNSDSKYMITTGIMNYIYGDNENVINGHSLNIIVLYDTSIHKLICGVLEPQRIATPTIRSKLSQSNLHINEKQRLLFNNAFEDINIYMNKKCGDKNICEITDIIF